MKIYKYPDPILEEQKTINRIAVVTTAFVEKEEDMIDDRSRQHSINIFKYMLRCHEAFRKYNPLYDFIIVDNFSTYPDFKKHCSDYIYLRRENTGFSVGGYMYAWETFGKKYDYYLFHEQDIIPAKKHWLKDIVNNWFMYPEVGFIGNTLEHPGKRWMRPNNKNVINTCGSFLFTSAKILANVSPKVIYGKGRDGSYDNNIQFSQAFLEKGYSCGYHAEKIDGSSTHFWCSRNPVGHIIENDIKGTISPMITYFAIDKFKSIKNYFKKEGL